MDRPPAVQSLPSELSWEQLTPPLVSPAPKSAQRLPTRLTNRDWSLALSFQARGCHRDDKSISLQGSGNAALPQRRPAALTCSSIDEPIQSLISYASRRAAALSETMWTPDDPPSKSGRLGGGPVFSCFEGFSDTGRVRTPARWVPRAPGAFARPFWTSADSSEAMIRLMFFCG